MTQNVVLTSLMNSSTVLLLTTPFLSYRIQDCSRCQPEAAVLPSKTFVDFGYPLHIFLARSALVDLYNASSPMHLKAAEGTLNQLNSKHGR